MLMELAASGSALGDRRFNHGHGTTVDQPVKHGTHASRLGGRALFRVLVAAFGLYARFVFAEVEPPVGRSSRPLAACWTLCMKYACGLRLKNSRSFVFQSPPASRQTIAESDAH